MKKKLWGGRFKKATDTAVEEFTSSIAFDKRLYKEDIKGSIAHCRMLEKIGLLSRSEGRKIRSALKKIEKQISAGRMKPDTSAEDIHMYIEAELTKLVGNAGKKIHTGRSRNDQIALDVRMYLKSQIEEIYSLLKGFIEEILSLAEKNTHIIVPGYTHLQHAQPVLLSHYLLAYGEMFIRDLRRIESCYSSADIMPLGAGALAGSNFNLDRKYVAKLLGFKKISSNSIDSVSDRDYQAEFLFFASLLFMHLSRLCEELILWNSSEFSFIELPDEFTTGSSIMPQKKNPDVLELIRGKTGRVYGDLVSLLTLMKSQPLSYNRDMQEDKEPLFDAVDTVKASLRVLSKFLGKIRFREDRIEQAVKEGFMEATDIADYLVLKNVPFREAHEIVGKIVLYCIENNCRLQDMSVEKFSEFHKAFNEDIKDVIDYEKSVSAKRTEGGTSLNQVMKNLKRFRRILKSSKLS
ncbi:MAG: argininosuccinate lyase [Candidatus Schekmanbacteria bacterium]|nr:MAG: argininosuccinate lyase [Candidatus Schekmanbacteria bacterium]